MPDTLKFLKERLEEDLAFAEGANIFEKANNWTYSREHGIKSIRFQNDFEGPLWKRLNRAVRSIRLEDWQRGIGFTNWLSRLHVAWLLLFRENNTPDGCVTDSVLTFWEEDGEHIERWGPQKVVADLKWKIELVDKTIDLSNNADASASLQQYVTLYEICQKMADVYEKENHNV